MKYRNYKYLILSDLYRVAGSVKFSSLLRNILFGESFKYIFWMRTCRFTREVAILRFTIYPIAQLILQHYTYKFSIGIQFITDIGSGFYIGHFGGVFIYPNCRIGKNCNISQGVTIGNANRGKNKGCPIIGDNVYIGPGAKIIGAVNIGDHVAIGANCVVTKDVPDFGVVVGVPGKVISYDGSTGYVNNTDYEDKIR